MQRGKLKRFALPDYQRLPPHGPQFRYIVSVAFEIPCEFGLPKVRSRRGVRRSLAPFMAVPEAPMNENDLTTLSEHQVWCTGQALAVQPKAIS